MKNIFVLCLLFVSGFAFAKEELGYVYFKYEVVDTPWTGYVPPHAANLREMVCLDITFISNLPKEYTDYFIDVYENNEINVGLTHAVFGRGRKSFALFTRTENGFISRRPFAKKWDHAESWDSPNLGSYEFFYAVGAIQQTMAKCVQFILDTTASVVGTGKGISAQAVGNTSVPNLFDDAEQGFHFRKTKLFERKWVVYRE
ncbi:hypothetical protein FACS1894109_04040 [Spirochaetia bacterium]|nr:hypothetical protein FACS1894109_04040 [Spirochaetia bacterium]